jgi:hypothetical protein
MNWLLFILRLLLGYPESSGAQRVAIRPDGSTVVLPVGSTGQRWIEKWGWLLPHSLGRDRRISVPSVEDFEHAPTPIRLDGDMRQRIRSEFQGEGRFR